MHPTLKMFCLTKIYMLKSPLLVHIAFQDLTSYLSITLSLSSLSLSFPLSICVTVKCGPGSWLKVRVMSMHHVSECATRKPEIGADVIVCYCFPQRGAFLQ